jgi:single-stranded DNA-binding protein
MRGVNKVVILGNVGQDPEYKALRASSAVST